MAASIADGVLTIRLGQSVTTNIDRFAESLGAFVTTGRRDPDGLSYRFALKLPVALHNSTQANRTAIDLVPDGFKGVPPELPPPPPPPAAKKETPDLANLPVVKLRVGEFSNYTQLVFEWPAPVPYTTYPGQGRISVRFETLAKPDFSVLNTRSPAWVKSAGWRIDGATTVVDFDTDAESTFRDFRDGAKIVVDVMAPKTDASAFGPPPPSKTAPAKAAAAAISPKPPPKGSDAAATLKPRPPASPRRRLRRCRRSPKRPIPARN